MCFVFDLVPNCFYPDQPDVVDFDTRKRIVELFTWIARKSSSFVSEDHIKFEKPHAFRLMTK